MNWERVVEVSISDDVELSILIGPIGIAILSIVAAFVLFRVLGSRGFFSGWETVQATVRLGGLGEVSIRPNYEAARIA